MIYGFDSEQTTGKRIESLIDAHRVTPAGVVGLLIFHPALLRFV